MNFGTGEELFRGCMCVHGHRLTPRMGDERLAGPGMETCTQTRLSLSWMEASCDAAGGHGRCDAFRVLRH